MNVKELKEKLSKMPDNLDVFVAERKTEFSYGLANSVSIREINLKEDLYGEVLSREKVVVIDEE